MGQKVPSLLPEHTLAERWDALFKLWRREVEVYCGKSITKDSNRLPAFSSIAQKFLTHGIDPPHLAGIWMKDSWRQLCWKSTGGTGRKVAKYLGLSFSWAFVLGNVHFVSDRINDKHISVVDVPWWKLSDRIWKQVWSCYS